MLNIPLSAKAMSDQRTPFQQQLDQNASDSRNSVGGMLAAGPYVGGTALITLPIMAVAGEGDYIIAVMAILFAGLSIFGWRKRRAADERSFERSLGFWIGCYSLILALLLAAIATAFLFQSGGWSHAG